MPHRVTRTLPYLAALVAVALATPSAKAQGAPGPCKDPWLNSAFTTAFHRAPAGSGTSGDCNPQIYGGGQWSGYADLQVKVNNSKSCPDAWVGEAFYAVNGRQPSSAECAAANYGGGHWTTYSDLVAKVQAAKSAAASAAVASRPGAVSAASLLKAPTSADLISDAGGNLHDYTGKILYPTGSYVIGENSSGAIGENSSGIIGFNGSGLAMGDVVKGGASGFSLQSVSGKKVIKGTIVRH